MSFFIVSGLSGSGKTIALQALEDIGFYCIDNLPAVLLPHFSGLLADMRNNAIMNVAIGLDVRNRAFLADLPKNLKREPYRSFLQGPYVSCFAVTEGTAEEDETT